MKALHSQLACPSLPSADLMAMYQHYAASKGWGWSPLAVAKTECDGVREASVGVSGTGACVEGGHALAPHDSLPLPWRWRLQGRTGG